MKIRYQTELQEVYRLACKNANLERNVKKPNFSSLTLGEFIQILDEEVCELKEALLSLEHSKDKSSDCYLSLHEIGDVAVCLAGALEIVNKKME